MRLRFESTKLANDAVSDAIHTWRGTPYLQNAKRFHSKRVKVMSLTSISQVRPSRRRLLQDS